MMLFNLQLPQVYKRNYIQLKNGLQYIIQKIEMPKNYPMKLGVLFSAQFFFRFGFPVTMEYINKSV